MGNGVVCSTLLLEFSSVFSVFLYIVYGAYTQKIKASAITLHSRRNIDFIILRQEDQGPGIIALICRSSFTEPILSPQCSVIHHKCNN